LKELFISGAKNTLNSNFESISFPSQKTILTFVKNRLMKKLILLAVIGLGIVSCTTQKNTRR
jgi:hypothetical protein